MLLTGVQHAIKLTNYDNFAPDLLSIDQVQDLGKIVGGWIFP